ncbi:pilus assembly protein CpaD [Sphingomonas sp. PP-F2F-A104-K0414]|uniref:CpaD family pilus assembly protein n=1 Tax=Sphingomonas sp. PP-F2F-A104-K0414 TaxID=2135661 RepID=UPI0010500973|nr:CpaD family pilus assembly protein [Sphingomonas sp. PP-F2F-A104-K0414]TCP99989.1 pilus assembly protein CpaD [Sphingomonas sp. PP-F2F-A104-K0414]
MINKSILAFLIPPLLLGGCMGTENRGLESVHQPVVSRSDYALDLGVAGGALGRGEQQRLASWLDAMRLSYGDRVGIDDPAAEGYAARTDVAAVVARYGLLLGADAPVTPAPVAPGTIRIVVSRMHADVPRCPDWSRDSTNDITSNTSSNYGCAINRNLAAMVANPADLVRGAPGNETTDTAVSYKAIDTYRKKAPTGAGGLAASSTGGK